VCGIAGVAWSSRSDLRGDVMRMTAALVHRGPDDSGVAVFPEDGVALGMRRLSIVDLEGGHQPMFNEDGTICVVFNGEIYNFPDLRARLVASGHEFRTDHSDTEVLVHGYEQWGREMFARLNGMFAVAIWDRREKELVLARDPFGEKPLYITRLADGYAFASELKALLTLPDLDRVVDPVGVEQFLVLKFTVAPRSLLRGVSKLPAAHVGVIGSRGFKTFAYWEPTGRSAVTSERRALEELDRLLDESVQMRMAADVPVGVFLSGGVDSSTIAYYMRRHSERVESFSIGFEESAFDERHHAERVARQLGTQHHADVLSERQLLDIIARVPEILDEPMGDSSILPTYLLSRFARQHVKVSLGGDGSDELFLGYRAYQPLKVAWTLDKLPRLMTATAAAAARRFPTDARSRGLAFARRLDWSPVDRVIGHLRGHREWVTTLLAEALHERLNGAVTDEPRRAATRGLDVDRVTAANLSTIAYARLYLQEDILVKVDRASMATSLEVRSPFLDPRIGLFALMVPERLRMRGLTRKYLLRKLMRGRLPNEILDRPKMGFAVPLGLWLRGTLAPLVRDYTAPGRLRDGGLFNPSSVQRIVTDHLAGRGDYASEVWGVLQLEMWRERWSIRV